MGKRIVIALGGNALGKNLEEQMHAVKTTASAIADLIEDGHEVVIAHGNGPQVGMIQNAFAAYHQQEAMSDMSAADLPAVSVEIMRAGPADGEILAAQGDYFQAVKGGGHGDYCNLVLAPYSVQELCELMQESFELAEKYRNPVILLSDATLA